MTEMIRGQVSVTQRDDSGMVLLSSGNYFFIFILFLCLFCLLDTHFMALWQLFLHFHSFSLPFLLT